MIIWKRLFNL